MDELCEELMKEDEDDDKNDIRYTLLNVKFLHDEYLVGDIIGSIEFLSIDLEDKLHKYTFFNCPMNDIEDIFHIYDHQELSQLSCIKEIKDILLKKIEESAEGEFPCTKQFLDKYYKFLM